MFALRSSATRCTIIGMFVGSMWAVGPALAQESMKDMAKKLANPLASMISVPFQYNVDEGMGASGDGVVHKLNIQPVWPFSLSEEWNLIARTILPVIDQDDVPAKGKGESGIGDIVASQWFSPKEPTATGWILGVGFVELLPTATEDELGADQFGLGPTVVALKQIGPWTTGMMGNHIWSLGSDGDRDDSVKDVNATFLQPFLTYITKTKTTLVVNSESTYDWTGEEWVVPINFMVNQMVAMGGQPIQVGVGARYWADSPENGPDGWGARVHITFLFPK